MSKRLEVSKDELMEGEIEGEYNDELLVRDPSFFATPWDPPERDIVQEDVPTELVVATNEALTEVQRVFIRTDATVRQNRMWKGRYDRFNGKYIINALKEALVNPTGLDDTVTPILQEGEENEGEEKIWNEEEEGNESAGSSASAGGEEESEIEEVGPVAKIMNILNDVQKSHEYEWKKRELTKLNEFYLKRVKLIEKTRYDWKRKIKMYQKGKAEQLKSTMLNIRNNLLKAKHEIEEYEMMKALRQFESRLASGWRKQEMKKSSVGGPKKMKYLIQPFRELPDDLQREMTKGGHKIQGVVLKSFPNEEVGEEYFRLEGEEEGKAEELDEGLSEWDTSKTAVLSALNDTNNRSNETAIQFTPLTFSLKLPEITQKADSSTKEIQRFKSGVSELSTPDTAKRVHMDMDDTDVLEKPVYVKVSQKCPNRKMIEVNLVEAFELSRKLPGTNPYELALCKTMGQGIFHQYPGLEGLSTLSVTNQNFPSQVYDSYDYAFLPTEELKRDVLDFFGEGRNRQLVTSTWDKQTSVPSVFLSFSSKYPTFNCRANAIKPPKLELARIGVHRTVNGRTEFVPEMKNFDHKTRAILLSGNKNKIRKLPVTIYKADELIHELCDDGLRSEIVDEHVTFRGAMTKFTYKHPLRIAIENNLTPEEYRKRYKGQEWMRKKLLKLFEEYTAKKNEIIEKGIDGRLAAERKETKEDTCCPLFWDVANYLKVLLSVGPEAEEKPTVAFNIPQTLKELKKRFNVQIVKSLSDLKQMSEQLSRIVCKWGGSKESQLDIDSIRRLIRELSDVEEFQPIWREIQEQLVSTEKCPLCLLFNFLAGPSGRKSWIAAIRQTAEDHEMRSDFLGMKREIRNLQVIVDEIKAREKPPVDPSLFPDKNIFHVVTTMDDGNAQGTFLLGDNRPATHLFVMRSCATVIFDLSRSSKEIPLVWRYLKQHMELLNRKDVRDEADNEPIRHLILITNFLSWAKSPRNVKSNISEKTFLQRIPHPDYAENYKIENAVHHVGLNHKQFKMRTTIIFSGIPIGEEEDVLIYLFKMCWDNELELPLFGPGRNVPPLVHIADLCGIVAKTVNERKYPPMIFVLNKNSQTLFAIATRIAKQLGSTKVVKFPSPTYKMKFCLPKIVNDLLKQDIRNTNVEGSNQGRLVWDHTFLIPKKAKEVVKQLRESRRLYGMTVLLIGPPSRAKSELAIIISKMYNLPLIHKGNILNYFLRATQENEPARGENEEEDEEEEEEPEEDAEEEDEDKKVRKLWDQSAGEKKALQFLKRLVDTKSYNQERKHLTKLLQKLLQSVFIQSHGYVLVDWPVRKEDTVALFTKILDEPQSEEELADPKPRVFPPPRPDYVIHVDAPSDYLDSSTFFLFPENSLKSFEQMEVDLLEYQYFRKTRQSVVDLLEERNTLIHRVANRDGFKVVGKLLSILGEPEQMTGREIYQKFLSVERAVSEGAKERGIKKNEEEKWLRKQYKCAINDMLTVSRERHFSLREQLMNYPLKTFKETERFSGNLRKVINNNYEEMRNVDPRLEKKWTDAAHVWSQVENRRWAAFVAKMRDTWQK